MLFEDVHSFTGELAQRFADSTHYAKACSALAEFTEDTPESGDAFQLYQMLSSQSERHLASASAHLFHAWLIDSLLLTSDPFACSPTGTLLRISYSLIGHKHEIGFAEWKNITVPQELAEFYSTIAYHVTPEAVWDGFQALRIPDGIIVAESPDWLDNPCDSKRLAALKNFHGWSLCFPEHEIPHIGPELLRQLEFDESCLVATNETEAKAGSRYIADCVISAYPNGRTGTWSEVERRVGYSRRSILRALKHCNTIWDVGAGKD